MGSNSSTMKSEITTDITNNFLQTVSTDIKNENKSELDIKQTFKFEAPYSSFDNCNINFDQTQRGTVTSLMGGLSNLSDDQKQKLTNDIANSQKQALEQANKSLNLLQMNDSEIDNNIRTSVNNNLETAINKTVTNLISTSSKGDQEASMNLYGMSCKGSDININQEQYMDVISENISENISESVQSNDVINKIKSEQESKVKQLNEGPSLLQSLSSLACIVSIIGFVLFMKFSVLKKGASLVSSNRSNFRGNYRGMFGGGDSDSDSGKGGKMIYIILALCVFSSLFLFIVYIKFTPKTDITCPSIEKCREGWNKIALPIVKPDSKMNNYVNCNLEYRISDMYKNKKTENCGKGVNNKECFDKKDNPEGIPVEDHPIYTPKNEKGEVIKNLFPNRDCETTCAYLSHKEKKPYENDMFPSDLVKIIPCLFEKTKSDKKK